MPMEENCIIVEGVFHWIRKNVVRFYVKNYIKYKIM